MKINYFKKIMMIAMILVSNNYLIRKINYSIQNRIFINILGPKSDYIYIINFFKTILNLHLKMVTSFLNNVISVLMEMGYKEIRFL
jgi:hypothetical protein